MLPTRIRNTVSNAVDHLHSQHVHTSGRVELVDYAAEGPMLRSRMHVGDLHDSLRHQLGIDVPRRWIAGMRSETISTLLGLGILDSTTSLYRHDKKLAQYQSLSVWQPEEPELVHVKHLWYDPRRLFRYHPLAWYLKRVIRTIVAEDLQVLKHCAYVPKPKFGRGEEALLAFRRWTEQFTASWP